MKYIKRRFRDLIPQELFPQDDILLNDFDIPVAIKLQLTMYVAGSDSISSHKKLIEAMKQRNTIRPCRTSALIRFLLEDLNTLLIPAIKTNIILVICCDRLLKIDALTGLVEEISKDTIINPETLLMIETDSL